MMGAGSQKKQTQPNPTTGKASALFYTLIDSCKRNGLDPEAYFAEVIGRLPEHATAEQAAELTPAKIAAARRLAEDAA